MKKTQKLGLELVPTGGSRVTAKHFLKISRNQSETRMNWKIVISHTQAHHEYMQIKLKHQTRTPLTWVPRFNVDNSRALL